ncbi:hypothetical protein M0R72_15610 [Candidatus Pacearchaeota archaeon]|jgi:hypothetical protein|nr:hypothetical protein [Candidatus Pacearchaeota archaeon]
MNWIDSEMHESVSIRPLVGHGAYGPIYGEAVIESWYCEPGFKRISNVQGQEVVASLFAIAPSDTIAAIEAEVTWNTQKYQVIDVQPIRPDGTVHHNEIYLSGAGAVE